MVDPLIENHLIIKPSLQDGLLIEYPKNKAVLFVIFLLMYEICSYISNDMIMPGMISVIRSFSAAESMVSGSLTAFILGGASLQIFLGPLSDRFGRRAVMLSGASFFLICTLLIMISQSIQQFIVARFFQGMGLCFISVVGYATLHEIFNTLAAIRLISIMNIITIIAPLGGPLLGAIVIQHLSWQFIFLIIAIPVLISLIGLWLYMPETVGIKKIDGTIIDFTSLRSKVIKENYLALVKNKRFMQGSIALGMATIPIIAWIGVSPLILIKTAHLNVIHYALWQLPVFFSATFGNMAMRYLSRSIGLEKIIFLGSLFVFLSLLSTPFLSFLLQEHYVAIVLGISFYSFGLGLISAPLNRLTLFSTNVPKGTASALISICTMVLIALGNQCAGWVYLTRHNLYFALFCMSCGCIYFLIFNFIKEPI